MADVRLDEFWTMMKLRLSSTRMTDILYGSGRIYRATDDYSVPEGGENEPWGRLIIVPVAVAWSPIFVPGESRKENFLIRTEFNNYEDEGYEVTFDLEAAQEEAYNLLEGWTPVLNSAQIVFNVYRRSFPQPIPFMDSPTSTWWTSSEYRFEAAPTMVP